MAEIQKFIFLKKKRKNMMENSNIFFKWFQHFQKSYFRNEMNPTLLSSTE